jgi:hypothetical protein
VIFPVDSPVHFYGKDATDIIHSIDASSKAGNAQFDNATSLSILVSSSKARKALIDSPMINSPMDTNSKLAAAFQRERMSHDSKDLNRQTQPDQNILPYSRQEPSIHSKWECNAPI